MPLPAHIVEHLRALVAAADAGRDHDRAEVAALADELTAWVGSPEGYVPRAVLAGALDRLVRATTSPDVFGVTYAEVAQAVEAAQVVRDGSPPPAWFVLADWGRMTDAERDRAEAFGQEARRQRLRRLLASDQPINERDVADGVGHPLDAPFTPPYRQPADLPTDQHWLDA